MKRIKKLLPFLLLAFCLTACDKKKPNDTETTPTPLITQGGDVNLKVTPGGTEEEEIFVIDGNEPGLVSYDEDLGNYYLDGIVYQLGENNEMIVTSYYEYELESITIPASLDFEGTIYPVTSIGEEALYYYSDLREVILPDSITVIDAAAFYYCTELERITLPAGLKKIGNEVFYGCESLTEINLPEGLESIGSEAFCGCISLTEVKLPDSVKTLGDEAFYGCESLKKITLSTSLSVLAYGLFTDCFELSEVVIPESIVVIGDEVFWACESLKELKLPNSLVSIGERAFYASGVESINLPDGVTISDGSFDYCDFLTKVYVPKDMVDYYAELFEYFDCEIIGE